MHFVNRPRKFSFFYLSLLTVALSIISIASGTISSSANSNDTSESFSLLKSFSFITKGFSPFSETSDSNRQTNLQSQRSKEITDSPVFQQFDAWLSSYTENGFKTEGELVNQGENLAIERERLLKELIRVNPQAAIEKAVSAEISSKLPKAISDHLEKRISANGDFLVYMIDETKPSSREVTNGRIDRFVVVGNTRYEAFVYGRREAMTTKLNIPLQGIVIGDVIAVDENPGQKIESSEYAARSVDETALGAEGVAAEIGGKIVYYSNQTDFQNFVNEQIEWESKIGPVRPEQALAPQEQASTWTEGTKSVLVIRVDFADKPGEPLDHYNQPLTLARAQNLINNDVSSFYANSSYNKTAMQATVTSVVRLPQTQAFYSIGGNYNIMLTDARIAALAAGFNTDNFDLDLVAFSYTPNISFVGIAAIGSKSAMLNGAFYLAETAHELGHNYGLLHANLWRTVDGTPIGAGSNIEYGDCYDNMGACVNGDATRQFNSRYKRILDWLTDANVQTVTTNGTYRIIAQDASTPGGIRTLKIPKDATKNYWVEFRQLAPGNAMNGALIRWDYASRGFQETQLLDMDSTTTTTADSPLLIGQSFYDSASNIRITVVGKGNTTPQSLDVKVEVNAAPTPTPTPTPNCTYLITPTSQSFSSTGGSGTVNVTATNGCSWTATSSQSFVSITSGSSGTGNGTVTYLVAPNVNAGTRSATITVAGQVFTVQQTGATVGNYTLVASPSNVAPGGQITVNFTAPAGSSALDWIGLFRVGAANTAYIDGAYTNGLTSGTISGAAPTQAGQYEFRYLLNDGYTSVASSNIITVGSSTPTPTPTTPTPTPTTPTPTPGTPTPTPTTPTPTPASCTYSITPASQNFNAAGGSGIINLTTPSSCYWVAVSNHGFISITSVNSGLGNSTISFLIAPNESGSARNGTVSIAGQTFTVTQAGASNQTSPASAFDFDGDGKADVSLFRPSNGIWYLSNSQTGFTGLQFGAATDKVVPADYDGDGRTDVAVYRSGVWYMQRSSLGFTNIQFGIAGDIPVPADYDGDGKTDIAVYRPSSGTWFLQRSQLGFTGIQFGISGDKPVAADFDGDTKADLAVFRPSNGIWYIQQSTAGFTGVQFGDANDKLVPADYDGDGKTDVAVYRPSNGFWYLNRSQAGFTGIQFGLTTDVPVPADYDGDGKADIAVFRDGMWFLQRSTAGFTGLQFGASSDTPAPNAFVN